MSGESKQAYFISLAIGIFSILVKLLVTYNIYQDISVHTEDALTVAIRSQKIELSFIPYWIIISGVLIRIRNAKPRKIILLGTSSLIVEYLLMEVIRNLMY